MSWRFRKTFKVLPGIKVNLTRHGLSTTVGPAPFSLNVGPRGVYSNVNIPGTGVWDRVRLDTPSPAPPSGYVPRPSPAPSPPIAPLSSASEIRSASTEMLNSASMAEFQRLLKEAFDERVELGSEIKVAENEAGIAAINYRSWEKGFLFRRIFKRSFAKRQEAHETAQAKCQELQQQLRLTTLATQIDIEPRQAEPSITGCVTLLPLFRRVRRSGTL